MKLAQEGSRTLSPFLSDSEEKVIRVTDSKKSAEVVLPPNVFKLLIGVLAELGRGNSVTVMPLEAELTTQQAADLLNVSRPFLVSLLDEGKIPFRLVGTHRRVRVADLVEYKQRDDAHRKAVLDELTAEAEKHGLGY